MAKQKAGFGDIATEAARPITKAPTVNRKRSQPGDDVAWEEANKRATFYLPVDMIAALKAAAADNEISSSRFVVEAIEAKLNAR